MKILCLVIVVGLCLGSSDTPAQSMMEMTRIARRDYEKAETQLNSVYQKALARLSPKGKAALCEAQAAWIIYRDKNAEAYGTGEEGGSLEPYMAIRCREASTKSRIAELKSCSCPVVTPIEGFRLANEQLRQAEHRADLTEVIPSECEGCIPPHPHVSLVDWASPAPVITKSHIPSLWLAACPSFGPAFAESCVDVGRKLLYIHAGAFARHLLALHRAHQRDEFPAVAAFVERLHSEGDHYTREFAAIGILEGIQNVWTHPEVSPDEFLPLLQPLSAVAWYHLNHFWAGEIPVVPDVMPGNRDGR